jgi:hypothetical protein
MTVLPPMNAASNGDRIVGAKLLPSPWTLAVFGMLSE